MSDYRSWFKLKFCWMSDPEIQALSERDQLRWVQLLTLCSEHGQAGSWVLKHGVSDLPVTWRRGLSNSEVLRHLVAMPGVAVSDGPTGPPSLTVAFVNWLKHQTSSADRQRTYRSRTAAASPSPSDAATGSVRHGSRSRSRSREDKNPPTPHVIADDCGHPGSHITYVSCSDRHFAERRAWLEQHKPNGHDPASLAAMHSATDKLRAKLATLREPEPEEPPF